MDYKDENKNLIEYRAEVKHSRREVVNFGKRLKVSLGLELFDAKDVDGNPIFVWDNMHIKHENYHIADSGRVKHTKLLQLLGVSPSAKPRDLLGKQCIVTLRPYRGVPKIKAYKHFNNTIGEAK